VLHLTVDTRGGSVVHADLLAYPSLPPTHKQPNPPPTTLLDNSDDDTSWRRTAWSAAATRRRRSAEPSGDLPERENRLHDGDGQNELNVDLTWQDAAGLKVTKTYSSSAAAT
jgi:YidC/Oxa1 family membrane protein insertase